MISSISSAQASATQTITFNIRGYIPPPMPEPEPLDSTGFWLHTLYEEGDGGNPEWSSEWISTPELECPVEDVTDTGDPPNT